MTAATLPRPGNALDAALLSFTAPPPGFQQVDRLPFDHERRLMSALVATPDGSELLITKGAPESLLQRCVGVPAGAASHPGWAVWVGVARGCGR